MAPQESGFNRPCGDSQGVWANGGYDHETAPDYLDAWMEAEVGLDKRGPSAHYSVRRCLDDESDTHKSWPQFDYFK